VFALGGADVAASGDYFARLTASDAEAADGKKAEFEKYVTLEWNHSLVQASTAGETAQPAAANPVFLGATGPRKLLRLPTSRLNNM